MAKSSTFRRFVTALKRHWKVVLPDVKPLKEGCGHLPKASSFDAGIIPAFGQRVYLEFQTTWKEAGYFTINFIVADPGREVSGITQFADWKAGQRLEHGGHRISHFLGDRRHDKWWHLRDVERGGWGDNLADETELRLRLSLREGNWTAASYAEEEKVIEGAVADVTRDVKAALIVIGVIPGKE
jgi:hypothetical protein